MQRGCLTARHGVQCDVGQQGHPCHECEWTSTRVPHLQRQLALSTVPQAGVACPLARLLQACSI